MDLRFRGLSGALVRRFARKAGSREQERVIIAALIEAYIDGKIDPLAEGDPIAAARGAKGGYASGAALSDAARSARAKRAAEARWGPE